MQSKYIMIDLESKYEPLYQHNLLQYYKQIIIIPGSQNKGMY